MEYLKVPPWGPSYLISTCCHLLSVITNNKISYHSYTDDTWLDITLTPADINSLNLRENTLENVCL